MAMQRWHRRWARLRDSVRRSRLERDIDDELRFHLEAEIEANLRRGLTLEQARAAAHDSLGGPPLLVREAIHDARGVSFADDFRGDVRQGVRLLRRSPGAAAVIVCTLAIAIGGAVTAFSITDKWLFQPLRFPDANRLVVAFMATAARPTEPAVWMPYRAYQSWKDSARGFASVSAAFFHAATWRTSSEARSLVGMRVTPDFFSTLGVPALRGRHVTAADASGPPVIVLSHGFWQRELGGAEDAIGSRITLSDVSYAVVGIMPADFDVRLLDRPEGAAYWTLFREGDRGYTPGGMGPVTIIGRLADTVAIESARAEAAAIMRRAEAAYPINFNQPDAAGNPFVVNLSSLQADNTRTIRSTLLTVLAAATGLLVIAAMNVGVMLLGRGLGRRGEVAVRHALGAGRGRLVRQFLTESLVLSVCGGALGLAVAVVGLRLFVAWNPLRTLPAGGVSLDTRTLVAATLGMALTTIVAGLVPAIRLSALGLGAALRSGGRSRATAPTQRAQRVMLVAQIAVSTVLLVCAGLLARTVIQLRGEPLGFVADGVAVAEVALPTAPFDSNAARNEFYRQLEARLVARQGIRSVAASTAPPLQGSAIVTVNLTAVDSPTPPRMGAPSVTMGFFDTLDIPILAGRRFDRRDSAQGRPVAILNARAAAQLFGDPAGAIGKRLRLEDEDWREVVGVVGNVRTTFFNTLEWRTDPFVYRPATQGLSRPADLAATHVTLWVHIRADRPVPATEVRDATTTASSRAAVLSLRRVPDLVADATRQPTFRMTLLMWFCGASLLLAAIGVYGNVTQAVTERLSEIAIRLALGADPRTVMVSLVRNAMVTGAAGLAIGVTLSMLLTQALESMLYGVPTSDAASLAIAGVVLLGVTSVAAWLPALRATRVDTVQVLRA
jgi:putative ABC transport system permease protein